MAFSLQVATGASLVPSSSSLSSSIRRRAVCCSVNARGSSKFPMPPINPNDPFLSRLASVASNSPELLSNRPVDPDMPPYMDIFYSPKAMAPPGEVQRASPSYQGRRPRRPPPDLPSLLLDERIVYIGMPLVPAVTELIIAELMVLQYTDPNKPIFLYINSTGTTRDDGEPVGMESEGFAIYDALMQMKTEIYTVAIGAALGHACLLLACGTKGKRFMLPFAKVMIQQPRVPSAGLMPASDVLIRAKEAIINRDNLVELLAKHTGNPVEVVAKVMRRPFYMDCVKAKEFGVIDKILWRGMENMMPPSEKTAGLEDVHKL